jgi:hypothetical protein
MGTDLDGIRKENDNVWNKTKRLQEKLKVVDCEINALQEELTALFQKRDKALGTIHELRKQRDEENTFFKQSREVLAQAKLLAVADGEKRKEAIVELEQLSLKEVDNFISLYSKDKSFRDDYQRRILSSLDMRQFSKDGRIRNPDEKPILAVEAAPSEPEMVSKAPVKRAKEEPKSSPKEDTLLSQKDVNQKESKSKLERVDDADEETFVVEKARKDAVKEKEIDVAKLKEVKREEEMAKAKQAMERKKKLADKAAAKAALRAQKEAEKKLKDREKKAKKKAAASQVEEPAEPSAEASEPEEVVEEKEEPSALPVKQQKVQKESKVRSRNRTRGPESIPKSILKRKKSTNYYWMLAVPAGLAVLIILVLAYYRFL